MDCHTDRAVERTGNCRSLEDVIQELGLDARDCIIAHIQEHLHKEGLKAARLACRALRELVDGSLQKVSLQVRLLDKRLWREGTLSPLRRWHRCTGVTVILDTTQLKNPLLAGDLLALPFVGLPLEARRRITSLRLQLSGQPMDCAYHAMDVPVPATAIACLLRSLPLLQSVELCDGLPDDSLQQRHVYDALASLPHLTDLTMPYCSALNGLGALADGRLKRLTLNSDRGRSLSDRMRPGVEQLRQLEFLRLEHDSIPNSALCRLLRGAPPALRTLELYWVMASDLSIERIILRFQGGRITAVEVNAEWMHLDRIARFADCVLLQSGAVARQLERWSMPVVRLQPTEAAAAASDFEIDDAAEPAGSPSLGPLRALLQRCTRVVAGTLRVASKTPLEDLRAALAALGDSVAALELELPYACKVRIRLAMDARLPPMGTEDVEPARPSGPSLLDLALERLAAEGAAAAAAGGGYPDGAGSARSVKPCGSGGGDSGGSRADSASPCLLLLRGPLLSGLAWAPEALGAWVRRLTGLAKAAAKPGPTAEAAAALTRPAFAYLLLPHAGAVLVQCHGAGGMAALEEAANGAAAAATQPAAVATGGAAMLQVMRLALPCLLVAQAPACGAPDMAENALLGALAQAAQCMWNGEGPSAAWSPQQRLAWVMRERDALQGIWTGKLA